VFSFQFSVFSWWNREVLKCAGLFFCVPYLAAIRQPAMPLTHRPANIQHEHPFLQLKTENRTLKTENPSLPFALQGALLGYNVAYCLLDWIVTAGNSPAQVWPAWEQHAMALEIAPGKTRIGWVGTGVMGSSMCGHLMAAGYQATVFNRTAAKAQPLVAKGAKLADSPRAVAVASDVVFTIVGYPHDVRDVTLGESGTLAGARPGTVLVDMTTSEPALAIEIAARASAKGVHAVDAPVSGGDVGAREARLSIMIGGEKEVADALLPLFQVMGKTIIYQGPAGAGQHTKMVNQILIATNMIGVCEAMLYAYRAGLDLDVAIQSVSSGAAGSWSLSNLAPRMIAGNFEPGFFVEHFLKDMGIALAEARRMKLSLPGLALAEQLYRAVEAQGYARKGTQALMLALAQMSAIDWAKRN